MRATAALVGQRKCLDCGSAPGPFCRACIALRLDPLERFHEGTRCLTAWAYDGVPRSLVLGLKLRYVRAYAQPLAEGLRRTLGSRGSGGEVLTWVPCRAPDKRRRGFDHAELICRCLSLATGLPVSPLLARRGKTRDQASLGRVARAANLRGAFVARPSEGRRVILVDDLITTGATADACTRALRGAGARSVDVIAPCRA